MQMKIIAILLFLCLLLSSAYTDEFIISAEYFKHISKNSFSKLIDDCSIYLDSIFNDNSFFFGNYIGFYYFGFDTFLINTTQGQFNVNPFYLHGALHFKIDFTNDFSLGFIGAVTVNDLSVDKEVHPGNDYSWGSENYLIASEIWLFNSIFLTCGWIFAWTPYITGSGGNEIFDINNNETKIYSDGFYSNLKIDNLKMTTYINFTDISIQYFKMEYAFDFLGQLSPYFSYSDYLNTYSTGISYDEITLFPFNFALHFGVDVFKNNNWFNINNIGGEIALDLLFPILFISSLFNDSDFEAEIESLKNDYDSMRYFLKFDLYFGMDYHNDFFINEELIGFKFGVRANAMKKIAFFDIGIKYNYYDAYNYLPIKDRLMLYLLCRLNITSGLFE